MVTLTLTWTKLRISLLCFCFCSESTHRHPWTDQRSNSGIVWLSSPPARRPPPLHNCPPRGTLLNHIHSPFNITKPWPPPTLRRKCPTYPSRGALQQLPRAQQSAMLYALPNSKFKPCGSARRSLNATPLRRRRHRHHQRRRNSS